MGILVTFGHLRNRRDCLHDSACIGDMKQGKHRLTLTVQCLVSDAATYCRRRAIVLKSNNDEPPAVMVVGLLQGVSGVLMAIAKQDAPEVVLDRLELLRAAVATAIDAYSPALVPEGTTFECAEDTEELLRSAMKGDR